MICNNIAFESQLNGANSLGDSLKQLPTFRLGPLRAAPKLELPTCSYLVDRADLPIFQTMVSTCRTGTAIDRGAREDRRATTAIRVEKVLEAVLAQLDALAVSAC
jgi:hypothetical protein